MSIPRSFAGGLGLFFAAGQAFGGAPAVRTVPQVDLARYAGAWHVIACTDNPAERNFAAAVEHYAFRDYGTKVDVTFRWHDRKKPEKGERTHRFTGRIVDRRTNATWKMRLFPLFSASYLIIALGPDYEWAAVAHPSRKFGWVLAREPRMDDETYTEILGRFRDQGYDSEKFIRLPQRASAR